MEMDGGISSLKKSPYADESYGGNKEYLAYIKLVHDAASDISIL